MKHFFKILTIASPLLVVAPLVMTSCSNGENKAAYETKVQELKTMAIEEFQNICKYPHPSFHLGRIYTYLCQHIRDLGYEPHVDNYAKDAEKCVDKDYGNIWFDIPGTPGCENWKKIIIQGHMDMVFAGDEGVVPWEKVIEPVIANEIDPKTGKEVTVMHSKNHETSLGADDGIGIATMFAIARHSGIKHGPIRFVITGDEEDGCTGARWISKDVFDSDYLINVDGEIDGGLAIACYGVASADYEKEIKEEDIVTGDDRLANCFELQVRGLHGGHSGEQVGFRYGNAERFAYQVLHTLITDAPNKRDVQLVSIDQGGEICKSNAMIPSADFVFYTNATEGEINTAISKTISNELSLKYTGEDWSKITFKPVKVEDKKPVNAVCADLSSKFIKCFGDEKEGMYCGLVVGCRDEAKHVPGASCNMGPTVFDINDTSKNIYKTTTLGRAYQKDDIRVFADEIKPTDQCEVKRSFHDTWYKIFGEGESIKPQQADWAWEDKKVNPVRDILVEGYRKIGEVEPNLVTLYGMLEQSLMFKLKPSLNMITIGPRIDDCHVKGETLYLDTMDNEYRALLYALQNFGRV